MLNYALLKTRAPVSPHFLDACAVLCPVLPIQNSFPEPLLLISLCTGMGFSFQYYIICFISYSLGWCPLGVY